jgi:hypothetical protein
MLPAWRDTVERWGATAEEIRDRWPCDDLPLVEDAVLFRAVTVRARPAVVYRWLCQLRVAPYSYDWIDHRGRRSPTALSPGLEELTVGQTFMSIFRLAAFAPDDHITLTSRTVAFGEIALTYRVRPDPAGSRLSAKVRVHWPGGLYGRLVGVVLPAGDLVMMRKQLRTLASLAEATGPLTARGG